MASDKICPVCIQTEEIEWSDLQSDRVELCNQHRVAPEGELPLSGELK